MLTYRTGAAGAPSTALAMAQHLKQQTVPTSKAEISAYYMQNMAPPSQVDETLAKYAELVAAGGMSREAAIEVLITREIERAAASPQPASEQPGRPTDAVAEALGKMVAASLVSREEAQDRIAKANRQETRSRTYRTVNQAEAEKQLFAAMEGIGLKPQGKERLIEWDGKPHYVTAESKKGGRNSSGQYTAWLQGTPAAFLKNRKTGIEVKWVAEGGVQQTISAEQYAADLALREAERAAAEKARIALEERISQDCARIWAAAEPGDAHPYLIGKGLKADGLRIGAPGSSIRVRSKSGEMYDQTTAGMLLVPMQDVAGKVWSLQVIRPDGNKLYLGGARRQGTFALFGDFGGNGPIGIGEGVATVGAVHQTNGMPVVAAFDAGGLLAAAQAMRALYPHRPLIMLADNDHENPRESPPKANAGLEKATEAAKIVGAAVAVPEWTEADKDLSDWDDWARKHGRDRMVEALQPALQQARRIVAAWQTQAQEHTRGLIRDSIAKTLDESVAWAKSAREMGGSVPHVRLDVDPALAEKLGIPLTRPMVISEVANLLNGDRTDGTPIPGKQIQKPTIALTELLELDPAFRPAREDIANILDGKTAKGNELRSKAERAATRRFLTKFGCKSGKPTPEQRENLLNGNMADGTPVSHHDYVRRVDSSKARIGYVDLTFSAPKSFSVAWALEKTEAGRAILDQCFNEAVDATLRHVETHIGQARKGKGAQQGYEQGQLVWVGFDHYSSRPTVAIVKKDGQGRSYTERLTVKDGDLIASDPQRHRHCLIPNAIMAPDGRIVGLDLQRLDDRVHEFGAYMQWQLAANLKRHGVETELDPRTKMLKLSAVPEWVCEQYAKRTVNGTEAAREYATSQGLDWDTLSAERQIALMKQGTQGDRNQAARMGLSEDIARQLKRDGISDWASWEAQAEAMGYDHQTVLNRDAPAPEMAREQLLEKAYQAALDVLDEEFQKRAGLSGGDLRVAALRGLIASGMEGGEAEVKAITRRMVTHGVKQDGQTTTLQYGKTLIKGREAVRATTDLHVSRELELIDLAQKAALDRSAALAPEKIQTAVGRWEHSPVEDGGLRFDTEHGRAQRRMIDKIAGSGRLSVLIGVAGSGKSALLKPLVSAWQGEGRRVFGLALAWRQADAFDGTGVQARRAQALKYFVHPIIQGRLNLNKNDVVVIDEVGLVGTRELLEILRLREKHGFTLVMLGDPKQCQSIDAGPVITLLERALGEEAVPKLLTTTRQLTDEERETTNLFREGKAEEALIRKRDNGTLHVVPGDYTAAVRAVADQWQSLKDANSHDPSYTISISAPTNHDARMISEEIRNRRRVRGTLGPDAVKIEAADQTGSQFDLKLAIGDHVRLFDSIRGSFTDGRVGNIGRNASVLEVRGFREKTADKKAGVLLRNKRGNEAWVSWDTLRGPEGKNPSRRIRLTYGDVLTTNSAQGETVDDHIHAMPGGSKGVNGFAAYTSGSRQRRSVHIFTSDGAERDEVARRRPLGDQRPVREWDVVQNLGRNLSRQPEKTSAIAIMEMVGKLKRNVTRGLQEGLHRVEAAEYEGRDAPDLSDRFERSRSAPGLDGIAERLDNLSRQHESRTRGMQGMAQAMHQAVSRGMTALGPALRRIHLARTQSREHESGPEL